MNKITSKMHKKHEIIAIVGATATGKTSYAIELAKKINGEIISADSRLVYKYFNIGTAKPSKTEMQEIPHYLIDVVEPYETYSAGLYKVDAEKAIQDIIQKGKIPIVVGGTGLYINILLNNYQLPKLPPDYRLRNDLVNKTNIELHKILNNLDAEAASLISQNDKKKMIRSIEIIRHTGISLKESRSIVESPYAIEWIGKNYPRDILYSRIDARVDLMIEAGLIDETKFLLKKYGPIKNITETIGYKEISNYINGVYSLDESIELLKKNTRNYAKRQLTWFRKNEEIIWDIYPEKLKK